MDDTSLSAWLRLREQTDWHARSAVLTQAIAARLPRDRRIHVLDLATGAGSNLRYLADRLPPRQHWLVIDRSQALLSDVADRTAAWASERGYVMRSNASGFTVRGERLDCRVEMRARDLGVLHDPSIFAGRHLVTASALLDLVSDAWLRALASRCRQAGATALFSITYDGRSSCVPPEPEDELVRGLMNNHQRRDKGLGGPAEGPGAASCADRCFGEEGYYVNCEASDWVLGLAQAPLQRPLIEGWADAASAMAPQLTETIASWRARRLAHVDAEQSHLVVGHTDLAAWRV